MQRDKEEESQFDSICFHADCKKMGEQLFLSSRRSEAFAHSIHQEFCKTLEPGSFKAFYDIPQKLVAKMVKQFEKSLNEQIRIKSKEYGDGFKTVYRKQAKKAFDHYMDKLVYKGCSRIMKKLKRNTRQLKDEETEYLTSLYERNQELIETKLQSKLGQLKHYFEIISEKLVASLSLKIQEIFFQFFDETPIKQEEQSPSLNEQEGCFMLMEKQQLKEEEDQDHKSQQVACQPAELNQKHEDSDQQEQGDYEYIEEKEQYSLKKMAVKQKKSSRQNRHVDISNIIEQRTSRRAEKVNYFNYHEYGDYSRENYFQKAVIIENSADIKNFLGIKKEQLHFHVLIINHSIEYENLICLIKLIKPKSIKINAHIINFDANLLKQLPKETLKNLTEFEEYWDFDYLITEYANCKYIPNVRKTDGSCSIQKLNITASEWNLLQKLENIWIGCQKDIQHLQGSKKDLENLKTLKIEPLKGSRINVDEMKQLLDKTSTLSTLILKNFVLDYEWIAFLHELFNHNNNHIKILVIKNIDNINEELINRISRLRLSHLYVHFENIVTHIDFINLLRISSLTYLSLKGTRFDDSFHYSHYTVDHNQLKNLQSIDLSHSKMNMKEIIKCLHACNKKILKYVNLEDNELTDIIAYTLACCTSLYELNIDFTSLNIMLFLKNFENKPMRTVQRLSILGFYDKDDANMYESGSFLPDQALEYVFKVFPNLKNINVSSHQSIHKARYFCPFSSLAVNGVQRTDKRKKT